MRIATSTIYNNQVATMDNLAFQQAQLSTQLSSGLKLNQPGDDPSIIAQDLVLHGTIAAQSSATSLSTAAQNELTVTDSSLAALTSILQSARSITVASATDVIPNGSQRQIQAKQIDGLLGEAIGLANAQYGNQYVFGGTAALTSPPVTATGSPANGVSFTGNLQNRTETINGVSYQVGTTLQQAFNYNATDGTLSVFQLLANLRNTMNTEPAVDQSGAAVNAHGQTIYGASSPAPTTLGQLAASPRVSAIQLQGDNAVGPGSPYYSLTINGVNNVGNAQSQTFTFTNATAVDGAVGSDSVVGDINAATANTGVTASWNVAAQRLVLTSTAPNSTPFSVTNTATPLGAGIPPSTAAATTTSNFQQVFGLQSQADVINNLSTQIGDIDKTLNNVLQARSQVGSTIQSLASTASTVAGQQTDAKAQESGFEDTNIAQATSQFTLVQTTLQAAYAVTSRVEGKSLMDYL